ncbi:hypothetical protein Lalb_Chr05g0217771 [Lupinus albus]|uniref:Uncharacterized protein n=1 Tax=Lupinus albus TaxID=3870 RepID=A0A6A4QHS8_LUPAL|nr:hypothetical protein Lalb_Chr05g0217771 [Lupinus albus]
MFSSGFSTLLHFLVCWILPSLHCYGVLKIYNIVAFLSITLPMMYTSCFEVRTLEVENSIMQALLARGCGWHKIGAFMNLGSYYIVGITLAISLAFILHLRGKAKKVTDKAYDSIIPENIVS